MSEIIGSDQARRYVNAIFIDSRGNVWLGTNEGIILFKEEKGESILYTVKNGLAGNTIQGIAEDDHGNLWISTNNGLSKMMFSEENSFHPSFTNYCEQDGLSGNEFKRRAVFKNVSGMMYFGTSEGFSFFHPDSIRLNQTPPEVIFGEMQLLKFSANNTGGNKYLVPNINSISVIKLPYNKTDFIISFAALNYLNPKQNQYKYMLSGYDNDWVISSEERNATYKNLKPGKYLFMVSGSNNDGVWSNKTKTLTIIIEPPFWQTLLFRLVLIAFVGALLYLFYKLRVRSIEKEKHRLELIVAKRTNELSDANVKLEEQSEELFTQNEELKRSQQELSLYKDHLEEKVALRTRELEIAKDKAEESERLKSSFLANMSHEIRTPLNAIIGFTALYEKPGVDNQKRKKYSDVIHSNTQSLLRLIDDILDLSTIEANQIKINYSLFPPLKIVDEVYQQFLPMATEAVQLQLKINDDSSSVVITADEQRFRQIISNLLGNAFKFTEQGVIELGFYPNNDNAVVFFVKDSGIGISKEDQKMVFNHFTKVEGKDKLFRGAGLGLAICKQLTELMGGKIWLESEPSHGSTFFFTLPVNRS